MTRAKASDRVYVYVYNTDTREGLLSAAAERRRGGLQMQLPEGWNELNIRMWGFVVDSEGRASGSAYVGVGDAVPEDGDVADKNQSQGLPRPHPDGGEVSGEGQKSVDRNKKSCIFAPPNININKQ